jgi:hypothetical protein
MRRQGPLRSRDRELTVWSNEHCSVLDLRRRLCQPHPRRAMQRVPRGFQLRRQSRPAHPVHRGDLLGSRHGNVLGTVALPLMLHCEASIFLLLIFSRSIAFTLSPRVTENAHKRELQQIPTAIPLSQTCAAAKFSSAGSTVCRDCAYGSYSSSGATSCTPCPAGSKCPDLDEANNKQCAIGTYSIGGQIACTPCAAGKYTDSIGQATCANCPAGSSCLDVTASPVACDPGYINAEGSSDSCSVCAGGTYADGAQGACTACPAMSACLNGIKSDCTSGQWSRPSASQCIECPAGYSCPSDGPPQRCAMGEYSASSSAVCTDCPAGSSCLDPAALPVACLEGAYSALGEHQCLQCVAGTNAHTPDYHNTTHRSTAATITALLTYVYPQVPSVQLAQLLW